MAGPRLSCCSPGCSRTAHIKATSLICWPCIWLHTLRLLCLLCLGGRGPDACLVALERLFEHSWKVEMLAWWRGIYTQRRGPCCVPSVISNHLESSRFFQIELEALRAQCCITLVPSNVVSPGVAWTLSGPLRKEGGHPTDDGLQFRALADRRPTLAPCSPERVSRITSCWESGSRSQCSSQQPKLQQPSSSAGWSGSQASAAATGQQP